MNTATINGSTHAKRTGTRRLAHGLWSVLLAAWAVPAVTAQPLWDDDDYLVVHQAHVKVYDHDFTYKTAFVTGFSDVQSITWAPDGWLRTVWDNSNHMMDVGPNGPDPFTAHRYRYVVASDASQSHMGDMRFAPDGAMFTSTAMPMRVWKFGPGTDVPDNNLADFATTLPLLGTWDNLAGYFGLAIVPDAQRGYVVWAGADFIRTLTPDLVEIPYEEGGVVVDGRVEFVISMHYDPATHTVLAGREFAHPTLAAVEVDVATKQVVREFHAPPAPGVGFNINGITRGADGLVVAADSYRAQLHVWEADGTYVRAVTLPDDRGGINYTGERASGSIVWAGNRPNPTPANTAPAITCPPASSLDCAPNTGTPVHFSVGVTDSDANQTLTLTLKEAEVVLDVQTIATPVDSALVKFNDVTLLPGVHNLTVEVTDATDSASCSTTVAVNADTEAPTISCPPDQAVQATSPDGAVVTFDAPTASDNCQLASVECDWLSGDFFPVGVTTVTCVATDAEGNTARCSFTVTVLPPAVLPGDLNDDGCVSIQDLRVLIRAIHSRSNDPQYDLNDDGRVNISDARWLVLHFTNRLGAPCR